MKKILLIVVLATCAPLGISAEQVKTAALESMSDLAVKDAMKNMTDQELGHSARTSPRFRNLAQPELARRIKKQRAEFKKHIQDKVLNLSRKEITYILPGVFEDKAFANIKTLYLNYNQLTTVVTDTFKGLKNLETLSLFNNQLAAVVPGAFNALNKLKWLSLVGNQLTEGAKRELKDYFAKTRPNVQLDV